MSTFNFIVHCPLAYPNKMEPTTGVEPVNLILTKDVLYLLSYVGTIVKSTKVT
jgi:hypothetical protein